MDGAIQNKHTLDIGLLVCDQVAPELASQYQSYGHMLTELIRLNDNIENQVNVRLSQYLLPQGEFPNSVDQHDAYITSGSKHSVNDQLPWIEQFQSFTVNACKASIPYIGICFGHQMLAKALGGSVEISNKGWGIGCTTYQFEPLDPLLIDVPEIGLRSMSLCISHKEQVTTLPNKSVVIAGNSFCPNSVVLFTPTAIGIQGHPEFSIEYCRDLMNLRHTLYPKACYEEGLQSLYQGIDQRLWAKWMLDFIMSRLSRFEHKENQ